MNLKQLNKFCELYNLLLVCRKERKAKERERDLEDYLIDIVSIDFRA